MQAWEHGPWCTHMTIMCTFVGMQKKNTDTSGLQSSAYGWIYKHWAEMVPRNRFDIIHLTHSTCAVIAAYQSERVNNVKWCVRVWVSERKLLITSTFMVSYFNDPHTAQCCTPCIWAWGGMFPVWSPDSVTSVLSDILSQDSVTGIYQTDPICGPHLWPQLVGNYKEDTGQILNCDFRVVLL